MKISDGVALLEIRFNEQVLNPVLIWDDEEAVLIDTGYPGQMDRLRAAIYEAGVSFDKLKAIILTHQDIDHIGNVADLLRESGHKINVYAHELEKPYIEGDLPLMKEDYIENPPKAKVDCVLADDQELPYCGGIQVIFTPGHTPGHISLYLKRSKTLVAGDSMYSADGILQGIHRPTTLDMKAARSSLNKYLNFDIKSVICYHGGLSKDNINEQLQELIRRRMDSPLR